MVLTRVGAPPLNWRDKYEEPAMPDTSELPELGRLSRQARVTPLLCHQLAHTSGYGA